MYRSVLLLALFLFMTPHAMAQSAGSAVSLFEKSAAYLKFVHKVSRPLRQAAKEERDLYSTLSGSYDHLAVTEFVEEAEKLRSEFREMELPQSESDLRRVYGELKTKADYLSRVRKAITQAQTAAKDFSANVPQPRMVSVGAVERLWLQEFPAASKAVSRLRSSILSRMREIERSVDITEDLSSHEEHSGPFEFIDLEAEARRYEKQVWKLLDVAAPKNEQERQEQLRALEANYKEFLQAYRDTAEYRKLLHRASEALPESERLYREKYQATSAEAGELQRTLFKLAAEVARKKAELSGEENADAAPKEDPAQGSAREGTTIPQENRSSQNAEAALQPSPPLYQQELLQRERVWQLYREELARSLAEKPDRWASVRRHLAEARRNSEAAEERFRTTAQRSAAESHQGLLAQSKQRLAESRAAGRRELLATMDSAEVEFLLREQQAALDTALRAAQTQNARASVSASIYRGAQKQMVKGLVDDSFSPSKENSGDSSHTTDGAKPELIPKAGADSAQTESEAQYSAPLRLSKQPEAFREETPSAEIAVRAERGKVIIGLSGEFADDFHEQLQDAMRSDPKGVGEWLGRKLYPPATQERREPEHTTRRAWDEAFDVIEGN